MAIRAQTQSNKKQRVVYLDLLRVLAAIAVIGTHVAAQNWYETDVNSLKWQVFNIYDSMTRWAVPVFVMISGAVMLGKYYSSQQIFKKIYRLAIAYIFWGTVLYLFTNTYTGKLAMVSGIIRGGSAVLWFIPMIIGLYLCQPILNKIVESKEATRYFLILSLIFGYILPSTLQIAHDFGGSIFGEISSATGSYLDNMSMSLVLGYASYFVGGYYLRQNELNRKTRRVIYVLGVIALLATISLTLAASLATQQPQAQATYYRNFTVNVLTMSVAVFVFFKYHELKFVKIMGIITRIAQYGFGIYLVHILFITILSWIGITTLSFSPILSVPTITIIVFILSLVTVFVISKIPMVRKYLI